MRIRKYRTELDENLHNVLVKESSHNYTYENLNNPSSIAGMLNALYGLNRQSEEHLYMVALNSKNRPLGIFEISHGSINTTICEPREIFMKALLCGAVHIVLAHNHPSQDTTPSAADLKIAERIAEAGKIIGIGLIDNLIVGKDCLSFKERGLL